MGKLGWCLLVFALINANAKTLYERDCVSCHEGMTITLDKFFFRYLLKYSSEERVKNAMTRYFKEPNADESILEPWLIKRIGVKKRTSLNEAQLREALDEYWKTYTVFGKLK